VVRRAEVIKYQSGPVGAETACFRFASWKVGLRIMTEAEVIRFLKEDLAVREPSINRSTSLFASGIIDSFSLIALMSEIENRSNIMILPEEINLDNFDSVERIISYISSKTK
jgi:acyl carrier protein